MQTQDLKTKFVSLNRVMTKRLVVVNWLTPLGDAYELLLENKIRHLPVEDDDGNIVGIMSEKDFMRALRVEQPDFSSGLAPVAEFDPNNVVRDFMTWPVRAIHSSASIATAARLMLDNKISALLVTDAVDGVDEVQGIVTTEDLLHVLIAEHETSSDKMRERFAEFLSSAPVGRIAQAIADAGI